MKMDQRNEELCVCTLEEFLLEDENMETCSERYLLLFSKCSDFSFMHDHQFISLEEGDILLTKASTDIKVSSFGEIEKRKASIVVYFKENFWRSFVYRYPELKEVFEFPDGENCYVLRTPSATWQGLHSVAFMMYSEKVQHNICCSPAIEALFISTLVHLNRTLYYRKLKTVEKKDSAQLMKDMINYIQEHYVEDLSLQRMSEIFSVSKSKITHLFKEKHNLTFYQTVLQQRLVHAKNAILLGRNISEVAYESGFSDYATFYKAFVKTFKMSPKAMQMKSRTS